MNNVALITGASSGIGHDLAKIHAQKSRDLIIIARREERLIQLKKELEDEYGVEVLIIVKDLANTNAAQEIFDEIQEKGIKIKYLINNAGFGAIGYFSEQDLERNIEMINVNIIALTKLSRLFLPSMQKLDEAYILNIASIAALMPGPYQAMYFATKAYVLSFSNALNQELENSSVSVTVVLPGPTKSEFGEISKMDKTKLFKKTYESEVVAKQAYKAMEAKKIDKIIGLGLVSKTLIRFSWIVPKRLLLKMTFYLQKD